MTHREKIELLRGTIEQLYVNEGRSKNYISKLLEVDREVLTDVLNNEWELIQGKGHRLKPSHQKFLNKHKSFILAQLRNRQSISNIAQRLDTTKDFILFIVSQDKALTDVWKHTENQQVSKTTPFLPKDNEIWKGILGYEDYLVSNLGRVRKGNVEVLSFVCDNVVRVSLLQDNKIKTLNLANIVGHTFVDKPSQQHRELIHIDGDFSNIQANNLQWVIPEEEVFVGKFKKILYKQYEFKTIKAFARFLQLSETKAFELIEQGKATLIY